MKKLSIHDINSLLTTITFSLEDVKASVPDNGDTSDYHFTLHQMKSLHEKLCQISNQVASMLVPMQDIVDRNLQSDEDEIALIRGWLFKKFEEMEREVSNSKSRAKKVKVRHPIGLSPFVETVIGVTKSDQVYYVLRVVQWRVAGSEKIGVPPLDVRYTWHNQSVTDKQWAVDVMARRLRLWCHHLAISLPALGEAIMTFRGEPWRGYNIDDFDIWNNG